MKDLVTKAKAGKWLITIVIIFIAGTSYADKITPSQLPHHQIANNTNKQITQDNSSESQPAKTLWDRTTDEPIALYTLFLAIFTFVLAFISSIQIYFLIRADRTARISADAATTQSKAVIAMESPIIILANLELFESSGNPKKITSGVPQKFWKIVTTFKNVGRTAATVKEICINWNIVSTLPEKPIYREPIFKTERSSTIIQATEGIFTYEKSWFPILEEKEVVDLNHKNAYLWIYGYITFTNFIGETYRTGFVRKWTCSELNIFDSSADKAGFTTEGPELYNYYEKISV
jgi:hypothetical protein